MARENTKEWLIKLNNKKEREKVWLYSIAIAQSVFKEVNVGGEIFKRSSQSFDNVHLITQALRQSLEKLDADDKKTLFGYDETSEDNYRLWCNTEYKR